MSGPHARLPVHVAALDRHPQQDGLDGEARFRDLLPAPVGEGGDGETAVRQAVGQPFADQPHECLAHDGQAHALLFGEVLGLQGVPGRVEAVHDRVPQAGVDLLGEHRLTGRTRHSAEHR